jgi:putative membrane protein
MMRYGNAGLGGHWFFAVLMMIGFWAIVAGVVIIAVRSGNRARGAGFPPPGVAAPPPGVVAPPAGYPAPPSPARLILDERFARGEIGEEEYRQRRTALDG